MINDKSMFHIFIKNNTNLINIIHIKGGTVEMENIPTMLM